ncbi:hypothetical protein BS50DRAFT_583952 [Corynespora cassiicola Philippines]|uniref:RING-type domain-containing protein n=1 Tax=Corynespora cassiicola Philippines TaxID=1448308 RepID=A0A2T2P419_CORCC|nr:hypothetical protein BS50DRAFT_583952 [Corynespora cassiicola Philippines]
MATRRAIFMRDHTSSALWGNECGICDGVPLTEDILRIVNINGCGHCFDEVCLAVYLQTIPEDEKKCPVCGVVWLPELLSADGSFLTGSLARDGEHEPLIRLLRRLTVDPHTYTTASNTCSDDGSGDENMIAGARTENTASDFQSGNDTASSSVGNQQDDQNEEEVEDPLFLEMHGEPVLQPYENMDMGEDGPLHSSNSLQFNRQTLSHGTDGPNTGSQEFRNWLEERNVRRELQRRERSVRRREAHFLRWETGARYISRVTARQHRQQQQLMARHRRELTRMMHEHREELDALIEHPYMNFDDA